MLRRVNRFVLALATVNGSLSTSAPASVTIESSSRTTWAVAGTPDDGGGIDSDTSTTLGPLTLASSMGPTEFLVESSVSLESSSSASGISGAVTLAQVGYDESVIFSRYMAFVWVDHLLTFVVETPTPYRMQVSTLSSTWELPPIFGLGVAAGAVSSYDAWQGGWVSLIDNVTPPTSGTNVSEGVLSPGQYTVLFGFTSAYFGPNTFDLSTASLTYSFAISAPGDLNLDGLVDATDLALLLGAWGTSGTADLNIDGTVDAADLAILLGSWT